MSGTLPPGWRLGTLADVIASISTGVSVNGEDRPVREGEVGVLKITAVLRGVFEPEHHKAVVGPECNRLTTRVSAGTILVSRGNGNPDFVGAAALVTEDHPNLYLPDLLWQVTPSRCASPEWLGLMLGSALMRPHIARIAVSTSTLKKISQSQYFTLPIVIPPRRDQDRIVEIVQTWDRYIALCNRSAACRQRQLEGFYCASLTRLAAATRVRLADLCRPRQWPTPGLGDLLREGFPVYGANGQIGFLDRVTHKAEVIAVGCRGSCGTVLRIPGNSYVTGNAMALDDLAVDRVSLDFLYHVLQAQGFAEITSGSSQPQITQAAMAEYTIPLPELSMQRSIAVALDAALQLQAGAAKLAVLGQQQKRILMAALLSGKMSVSAAERGIPKVPAHA